MKPMLYTTTIDYAVRTEDGWWSRLLTERAQLKAFGTANALLRAQGQLRLRLKHAGRIDKADDLRVITTRVAVVARGKGETSE